MFLGNMWSLSILDGVNWESTDNECHHLIITLCNSHDKMLTYVVL